MTHQLYDSPQQISIAEENHVHSSLAADRSIRAALFCTTAWSAFIEINCVKVAKIIFGSTYNCNDFLGNTLYNVLFFNRVRGSHCHTSYEQQLKIIGTEVHATNRRLLSVTNARTENYDQMIRVYYELKEIRNSADECSRRIADERNLEAENLNELQQKLNGLRRKEKQLAENLEQLFDEGDELASEDLNFSPLLNDLNGKWSETRDQLKVCRELEAHEQMSIQATISGVHCVN